MSRREKPTGSWAPNRHTTVSKELVNDDKRNSTASASVIPSSMIQGVCDDSFLKGTCKNTCCNLLHLTEPIQLTDAHFHDRLLEQNWPCIMEQIPNIQQFIGITNIHKAVMWNKPATIIPEYLKSQVRLYEACGIHPRYLGTDPHNDLLRLRDLIQKRGMIAVGECGLDLLNNEQLSIQTEIFASQIKLANEFHLPLILHCRQLDQQLFDILKNCAGDSSMKIQWHCCHSKGASIYREFLNYFPSSLLSIGGMCSRSGEKHMHRLVQELFESETNENQRRFVFETDSPYLKPNSLLTNSENNCPILGTLAVSAYLTKNVLKTDQWTHNLKLNTSIIQQFFNLT